MESVHLITIVGPTAVGKTDLAIRLALQLSGEVVSADSRLIYRYMDIGTAKPSLAERQGVPHHLIDVVPPDERLTLAQYQALAREAIEDIWARGNVPFLVGGTGLYVRALLAGWRIPQVPPDQTLRDRLEAQARERGDQSLHDELATVDPEAARSIDPRNVRRVIRALEVCKITGVPFSAQTAKEPPDYAVSRIGLTMPRELLYKRIDERIERMIANGLIAEVQSLLDRGYHLDLAAMSGLGYRQIGQYLGGEISVDEAVTLIKRHTRRFVRQQYNWFRLDDPEIRWVDATQIDWEELLTTLRAFLGRD